MEGACEEALGNSGKKEVLRSGGWAYSEFRPLEEKWIDWNERIAVGAQVFGQTYPTKGTNMAFLATRGLLAQMGVE